MTNPEKICGNCHHWEAPHSFCDDDRGYCPIRETEMKAYYDCEKEAHFEPLRHYLPEIGGWCWIIDGWDMRIVKIPVNAENLTTIKAMSEIGNCFASEIAAENAQERILQILKWI